MNVPRWLPNALTVLRIALIPAFVMHARWCAASVASDGSDLPHRALACGALLGIGLSDVVDGWLARRYALESQLGAVLDAVADKLAQITLLLFFAFAGGDAFARIPPWFVALLIGRDLVLALGTLGVRWRLGRVDVVHEHHGKLASLLLFGLLVWVTVDWARAPVMPAVVTIAVIVSVSTGAYVREGWRQWISAGRP
jgi:phosphatidylglycerophosphate synthase